MAETDFDRGEFYPQTNATQAVLSDSDVLHIQINSEQKESLIPSPGLELLFEAYWDQS